MRDYLELIARLKQSDDNCDAECCECSGECLSSGCNIFSEAADAIEELLAKDTNVPNKWISVEERLPEDQGDDARAARGGDYIHKVLAASVTPNYTVMDTAYLENGIWSLSKYTSWKQIIGAPVTHWMPLPAPPKGVE